MKSPLLPILLGCATLFVACERNSYKIEGTQKGLNDGDTLFLVKDLNTGLSTDTMIVTEGSFLYSGQADTATLAMLYLQKNPDISSTLFLEPGTINVHVAKEAGTITIGGTRANEALQEANEIISVYGKKMQELSALATTAPISQLSELNMMKQLKQLQTDMTDRIQKLADQNKDNAFGQFIESNLITE